MDSVLKDLRHAARSLRRSPGFTAIAVLTLALGIGANSAIYSVVDRVVLNPAPWPEPDRLIVLGWTWGPGSGGINALSTAEAQFWKDNTRSFQDFAITNETRYVLTGGGQPEQLSGLLVSDGYFRVIGVQPALGRAFLPEEDVPGGPPIAILTDGLWRRRFGADPGIAGRAVTLDGEAFTVVGVMPPGYDFDGADVLAPLRLVVNPRGQGQNYFSFGRLAPGITTDEFRAEMAAFTDGFRAAYPHLAEADDGFRFVTYRDYLVGDVGTTVWVLFGAVAFVLLIACANVANLLLARSAARKSELAVRAALGAGRGRILRHLLAESVLLSVIGGAAGLVLAAWALNAILALAPAGLAGFDRIGLNLPVLGFTLVVALLTGLAVGIAGALRALRPDLAATIREGGRTDAAGAGRLRGRGVLVMAEAALSVVLLVGAGLLIVSFLRLRAVDPGFEPEGVQTVELSLPPERYATTAETWSFERRVLERIRALPGVSAAGSASNLPLVRGLNIGVWIHAPGPPRRGVVMEFRGVSPGYFRAIGARLVAGRAFTEADGSSAPPVAVVNETFVRRFLPDEEALGATVSVGGRPERTVVGVLADLKDIGLNRAVRPTVFAPRAQATDRMTRALHEYFPMAFAIRTDTPDAVAGAVRRAIAEVDAQQPILRVRPMTEVVAASIAWQRFRMALLGAFGGLALVLTAVGIYGVISYSVRQRTNEIGIRMALGARQRSVLRLVVRQGMTMVLLGLVAGMAAAYGLTRLLSSMVFGVSTTDPFTFAGVAFVLGAVALLATYIPARRAARVDPVVALRYE